MMKKLQYPKILLKNSDTHLTTFEYIDYMGRFSKYSNILCKNEQKKKM